MHGSTEAATDPSALCTVHASCYQVLSPDVRRHQGIQYEERPHIEAGC